MEVRSGRCGRGYIFLHTGFVLHAQDAFAHFAASIFDDGRLPIRMALAQLVEQAPGKTIFGESGLKLVFVLEFFALLRRHVRFEKRLARIVRLGGQARRGETKHQNCEQDRPEFLHGARRAHDNKRNGGCNEMMGHRVKAEAETVPRARRSLRVCNRASKN